MRRNRHIKAMIAVLLLPAFALAQQDAAQNLQPPPANVPDRSLDAAILEWLHDSYFPLPVTAQAIWTTNRVTAKSEATPPTFEQHLADAEQQFQQKSAAAAPLIESVRKSEAELAPAQSALAAAQEEAASLQKNLDALVAEVNLVTQSRTTSDAERNKLATNLAQLQEALPLVAEALRHLTEAVGKAPTDATLTDAQRQITDKLKAMETTSADLRSKINELVAVIAADDSKLKDASARLEAARQESASVTQRVASLQSEVEKLAAALAAARQAAAPAESAVAQAQREIERWQNEIAFRDRMTALEAELAAARKEAEARQIALDEATKQLAAARSAADAAAARLSEVSQNIDALKVQIESNRESNPIKATEITEATESTK
jgi:chromosome segregation ATPase